MSEHVHGVATRGRRGRPPQLSRGQIVDAAVALVHADPRAPLTLRRVSDAVNAAPGALYRYFPERDDLLRAVADEVARGLASKATVLEGPTWQVRLRAWMVFGMESLLCYPQLLPFIAATRDSAWLPSFILLTEVLEPLALDDEEQARAIALIGTTVVGQAALASRRAPAGELRTVMGDALSQADDQDRRRVGPVLDNLPRALDRLFDVVVDSTIATIEALADDS